MNSFLEGFLSELQKEALIIPKGGLAAAKETVLKARNVPRSGNVNPASARREMAMSKRPPIPARPAGARPDAAPSRPATSNVPGVTPSAAPGRILPPYLRGGGPGPARPAAAPGSSTIRHSDKVFSGGRKLETMSGGGDSGNAGIFRWKSASILRELLAKTAQKS